MEERIFFLPPENGVIDLEELRQRLSANPCAFRHPRRESESWVVSPHPNTAKMVREDLSRNPNAGPGGSALLLLESDGITGYFEFADRDALGQVEALLMPLLRTQPLRLVNLHGQDVTEKYKGRLESLFG